MDFGIFLPSVNDGWIVSTTSPRYMPSFELNREIIRRGEKHGFAFALSMVRFRGFGGTMEHWDYGLESLTLTSALIATSQKMKIYASVATLTLPPPVAARMAVTIDDVAPGRFGLNIVAGWNRPEYVQMGIWPGDEFFDDRYEYAEEYVTILRDLWATGHSDFKGRFFTLEDCQCLPLPKGDIDIVYAGTSPRGHRFAAQYADYNFTIANGVDALEATNATLAAESAQSGRNVSSYSLYMVIIDDTDEAAEAKLKRYDAGADFEGYSVARSAQPEKKRGRAIGSSAPLLIGSPATVAAQVDTFAAVPGSKGMMLVFDDFLEGIDRFGTEVMPLLKSSAAVS